MVDDYIPGQRWISDAELQMGLGTILAVEHRTVTVHFLATGETRTYAKQTAPLTRVKFAPGDTISDFEGNQLKIESVQEQDGLLTYIGTDDSGQPAALEESGLNNNTQLYRPTERLFSGQIDQDKWFDLRYQTLQHINRLAHSELVGLCGARTSLIPHQLFIAHEVANRFAPRVLLADEVGLGKTIEAGLILHHQLLTERARRVLIVVPETLVHQWLVEMLRRFNLYFTIFDEERCLDIEESQLDASGSQNNPFHTEQLALCSLEFLVTQPQRFKQALEGEWDLLVVDEAHHLQWSPQQSSIEYTIIERLAVQTRGVLLLTATPEQLGKASHFARLRLLDPDRFHDFDAFIKEEQSYEPVAQAIQALLSKQPLDKQSMATLQATIEEGDNLELLNRLQDGQADADQQSSARNKLIEHLLDRHGTGRVLFRNTRTAVKGFPDRQVTAYPLNTPEQYATLLNSIQSTEAELFQRLCPECLPLPVSAAHWTRLDPRINWLGQQLITLKPAKVLVIAAHAQTALDIAQALKTRDGIHAAVFHEGLSIVERDRAAAFFADHENGSQVLICSEIGSEGRNFQFAHHLILFDLPLNPDLLEQRIGRLDRIGQTETIKIHVPYLKNTAQEVLFHWYNQGLSAFEHTCPAGHSVYVQVEDELVKALTQTTDEQSILSLVEHTQSLHQTLNETLHKGRDQLLEFNSCRPGIANALKQQAQIADSSHDITEYMENIYDCYSLDFEELQTDIYRIRPGNHMISNFPGLPEDGMTITYNRNTALHNEDIHYLSWEHPLVINAMDMVLSHELGNTAVTAVDFKAVKPGTLLLECLYIMETSSATALQSSRYLPPTTIRIVIDEFNNDHSSSLSSDTIFQTQTLVDQTTAVKIIRAKEPVIRKLISEAESQAYSQAPAILSEAHAHTQQTLLTEINRLKALQQINPNVRDEEITYFDQQLTALTQALESAHLRLDAIRVIVAT